MWAGWISCWSQPFLREFSPGTPVFHSPPKCNISKYQFVLYTVRTRLTLVRGNRNNSFTISTASLSETNTALSIGAPCKLLVTRPWPIPEKKMKIVVNGRFVPALWESSLPLSRSKTGCSRTSRLWAGEGGGEGFEAMNTLLLSPPCLRSWELANRVQRQAHGAYPTTLRDYTRYILSLPR